MAPQPCSVLLFVVFCLSFLNFSPSLEATYPDESQFFTLMKQTFSGDSLSRWDVDPTVPYCNYSGVACDDFGYVTKLDLFGWSLVGSLPPNICSHLSRLRILQLGHNLLRGGFPLGVTNCSLLEILDLGYTNLTGSVPDLSPLESLKVINLSFNILSGHFPVSFTNLTSLEVVDFNENPDFSMWKLPKEITKLQKLKSMILMTCSLYGTIPDFIGNLTSLYDLELSGNYLVGSIPREIGQLKNLRLLELYYNQLSGTLPEELANLSRLTDIDASVNRLTGMIPEGICRLPKLRVLQLYNNSLTGGIPQVIGNSTTLTTLSLYENSLTGELPPNLGKFSKLIVLDVSENRLRGQLPPDVCRGGNLLYFLVLDNHFSGGIPEEYSKCVPLLRFRVSSNRLSGYIPEGILGLPHVYIIDLGYNSFVGSLSKTIGNARNLSTLILKNNMLSGSLPPEIARATNLIKIELSNNFFSGPIPSEIGRLRKLNLLYLQGNKLVSSIPESLSSLKSLNVLNLSNNNLTGVIPESLSDLLPNSLIFSNNQLSGPVPIRLLNEGLIDSFSGNPGLCVPNRLNSSKQNIPICPKPNKGKRLNHIWLVAISISVVVLGLLIFFKRWFRREKQVIDQEGLTSWSSFSYDVRSFHKLTFDQREIVDALIDKNIVGRGGSGTVYKIELGSGQVVAVKKLWTKKTKDPFSDQLFPDRELKAEVETLGNIRHKNIVKLYCCFSNSNSNLLVYEYMPNGNLWDALHRSKGVLDWPTRHRIALGVAQGLAYLHHDLLPPIIHRDIKSTNILLNAEFQPKVADFGVAKVLQARGGKDSTTTVIAGTYGYLAPEYAYSSKATVKCDVYSFGVVLMELITGRKPIESEFGENKNIIFWVSQKVANKEGAADVPDKRLVGQLKDEIIQVLRIAIRCTCNTPSHRPTMKEVVQLLIEADPCRLDAAKSTGETK
ncbi:receptor protein-tyrosine kinase CEPR1 [Aristolochia californica]|uniref:receptor protein-tyrosine kinase CEPR1 n=1 Tax=Aristolochia californica TaxID=171875 RepID=UPI0035E38622